MHVALEGFLMRPESEQAAAIVRERTAGAPVDVALVLDPGVGAIGEHITGAVAVPCADLPGFRHPVSDPRGVELVTGTLGTARLAMLKGRFPYYETGDIGSMRVPLETLALLGAKAVVFAGSAVSIKSEIRPGAIIAIRDHINLTGLNPLLAETGDKRFVNLAGAYDQVLRERFHVAAGEAGRKTGEAVFMWFPGPSGETQAEINVARALGADVVGMSLVPDVIIARSLGLRVLGAAIVTNYAAGTADDRPGLEPMGRVTGVAVVPLTRVLLKFFDIWMLDGRAAR
jgi:purine-nucleoside phosphorylase